MIPRKRKISDVLPAWIQATKLQSTMVITIRDATISLLLRFDLMESIMPVSSVNLSE